MTKIPAPQSTQRESNFQVSAHTLKNLSDCGLHSSDRRSIEDQLKVTALVSGKVAAPSCIVELNASTSPSQAT